jgi:tRNA (mo5U34)-methyltransferase
MKRLSGEFLSRVMLLLQQCNVDAPAAEELRRRLDSLFETDDLYVEVAEPAQAAPREPRSVAFDVSSMARLNVLLPWSSHVAVGPGLAMGAPWSAGKRAQPTVMPDPLVEALARRLPLAGATVLELGCFEGHHSVSLAAHCKEVWAIDGRIENVVKTIVRAWMAGTERVRVELLDLERGRLREQLTALGRSEAFDLVHHRGVLYHLSNPIDNLEQCSEVCRGSLYLHTQVARDDQADMLVEWRGRQFSAWRYREPKTDFAPFAGLTSHAQWLTQSSLLEVIALLGFPQVEVIAALDERNGRRVELLAKRG